MAGDTPVGVPGVTCERMPDSSTIRPGSREACAVVTGLSGSRREVSSRPAWMRIGRFSGSAEPRSMTFAAMRSRPPW